MLLRHHRGVVVVRVAHPTPPGAAVRHDRGHRSDPRLLRNYGQLRRTLLQLKSKLQPVGINPHGLVERLFGAPDTIGALRHNLDAAAPIVTCNRLLLLPGVEVRCRVHKPRVGRRRLRHRGCGGDGGQDDR
jgi:hypothetical protein